jgi:hypothetical protein
MAVATRIRYLLVLGVMLFALLVGQTSAQEKMVCFLKDDAHQQWCGYSSEAKMKDQVQPLNALVLGCAKYVNGHVSVLRITETDETGDWAVNDEYTLNNAEKIVTLKRTINILPGNTSEEQLFIIENGKAAKQGSVYRELRTGRATQRSADWFQPLPVFTDKQAFPFSSLLIGKRFDVWAKGKVCVSK